MDKPGLFGIEYSTHDFSEERSWGKNVFTNAFPTSLACYINHKGLKVNYLSIEDGEIVVSDISVPELFSIDPEKTNIRYEFEARHEPFRKYLGDSLEKIDLVISKANIEDLGASKQCRPLEIKFTVLPDSSTAKKDESFWGSELVVRPPTIPYLACSLAESLGSDLENQISSLLDFEWWDLPDEDKEEIQLVLNRVVRNMETSQTPFILQAVWRTGGQSPDLSESCLDVFAWSNAALVQFFTEQGGHRTLSASARLARILVDIARHGKSDWNVVAKDHPNTGQGGKAFAFNGSRTQPYMRCDSLRSPRIGKKEISSIILGNGQKLLKPERRFDASLYFNAGGIFPGTDDQSH